MAIRKKTLILGGIALAVLYLWGKLGKAGGDCGCKTGSS
jgi:hypothetical protein